MDHHAAAERRIPPKRANAKNGRRLERGVRPPGDGGDGDGATEAVGSEGAGAPPASRLTTIKWSYNSRLTIL